MLRSSIGIIKLIASILILIGMLVALIACDNISTEIKDKAAGFLEDTGTKIQQPELPFSPQIATVNGMFVSNICEPTAYCLYVEVKPTNNAVAGKNYIVDLYEKGNLRDTTILQWNQPEINVMQEKPIIFQHIKQEEYNAYRNKNISHIFSINVREGTSSTDKHTVTGDTTFQALLSWGIPVVEIEKVIGDNLPIPSTSINTYATQKYRDFLALLSALQKLADRY